MRSASNKHVLAGLFFPPSHSFVPSRNYWGMHQESLTRSGASIKALLSQVNPSSIHFAVWISFGMTILNCVTLFEGRDVLVK